MGLMDLSVHLIGYEMHLLLTLASIGATLFLIRQRRTSRRLPPGPYPLPVIGNLLQLVSDQPHKSVTEIAKTYGPIMSLKLGRKIQVVISSAAIAKEVLQTKDWAFPSRAVPDALRAHDQHKYSLIWLPVASRWRSIRKILNSHIFAGNRLNASQPLRNQKVQDLIAYTKKCCKEGVAVNIGQVAFTTSLNVLSNALFSVDLANPSQKRANEFKEIVSAVMQEAGKPNLVDFFPALAPIDPQGIRHRMSIHLGKVLQLFHELIDERLEQRKQDMTAVERDVIDILLNVSGENGEDIDRVHIERLCVDMFLAGTDTSSSTLEWAMAELIHNQETLKKAKTELQQVIGECKPIEESDIENLPYLNAIIKETLRIHPPAPFVIRQADDDVEISGYMIPKGAQVLVNVWAIARDPESWSDPTKFMPERFLGSQIDVRGRDFKVLPFGSGRRICPGIPFAMRLMPVVLGSLLNFFDWELEGGIAPQDLDMKERFGITLQKAQPLLVIPKYE